MVTKREEREYSRGYEAGKAIARRVKARMPGSSKKAQRYKAVQVANSMIIDGRQPPDAFLDGMIIAIADETTYEWGRK